MLAVLLSCSITNVYLSSASTCGRVHWHSLMLAYAPSAGGCPAPPLCQPLPRHTGSRCWGIMLELRQGGVSPENCTPTLQEEGNAKRQQEVQVLEEQAAAIMQKFESSASPVTKKLNVGVPALAALSSLSGVLVLFLKALKTR